MADQVTKVDYFMGEIPNKPGEGARLLNALKDAGVNLTGFLGYPKSARKSEIVIVGGKPGPAAKKAGFELGKKQTGFFVNGADRPGVVAEMATKLAEAGINIVSCHAMCGGPGTFGALIVVGAEDMRKAGKLLGVSK